MLESFPIAAGVGLVLGFLAGLGIGGGSLLILWLTLVLGISHRTAGSINLLFFIPSAVIACLFRLKQGKLDLKRILPALAAGALSAAIFSGLAPHTDVRLLKKAFGILLLATGLRELFYRPRK